MTKKRIHIQPNGRLPDGIQSDKTVEWLEENYKEMDLFGRVQCPCCHSNQLTVLDIACPNCGVTVAQNRMSIDKDGTARMAGGMTAGELMKRAERWWEKTMRLYFKRIRSRRGDSISMTPELVHGSGILMGKHFDDLDRREKFSVCKAYYQAWFEENVEQAKKTPDVAAIIL